MGVGQDGARLGPCPLQHLGDALLGSALRLLRVLVCCKLGGLAVSLQLGNAGFDEGLAIVPVAQLGANLGELVESAAIGVLELFDAVRERLGPCPQVGDVGLHGRWVIAAPSRGEARVRVRQDRRRARSRARSVVLWLIALHVTLPRSSSLPLGGLRACASPPCHYLAVELPAMNLSQPQEPATDAPAPTTVWWLAVGAIAVAAVPALLSPLGSYERVGVAVLVVAALLAGTPRLGRAAIVLGPLAVLGVGISAGAAFWPHRMSYFGLALGTLFVAWASSAIRGRVVGSTAELRTLRHDAESRSIGSRVEEALAHRRRDRYVEREIIRAQRYGREVTVAFASIDNLHILRTQQGPEATETALASLGELFSEDSRLPDGGIGDDLHLVFVLPETPLLGGRVVAERVRLGFSALQVPGADGIPLTVSIGVASFPTDGQRSGEIIEAAAQALERAQSRGGNRTILSRSPAGTPAGWSATVAEGRAPN